MKKILLILSFFTFALAANAQFEIRPYVGPNFSNANKSADNTTTKAKVGGQIGIGLMFGNRIYFNPQIAYFSRGTEYSVANSGGGGTVNLDQKTGGVNIPLLIGVRLIDMDSEPVFNIRAFAGPSIQFLTSSEFTNSGADQQIDWKKNQWGAQVGAGIDAWIFFVDAVYEFGLSKTGKSVSGSEFDDIKNNTFYINAGVRLNLAK